MQHEHNSEHARGMAAARAYKLNVGGKEWHLISLLENTLEADANMGAQALAQRKATMNRLRHSLNELVDANLNDIDPKRTPSPERLEDALENFVNCIKEITEVVPDAHLPSLSKLRVHTKNMVHGMEEHLRSGEAQHAAKLERMRIRTEKDLAENGNWLMDLLEAHRTQREQRNDKAKPGREILRPRPMQIPFFAKEEADRVQTAIGMVANPADDGPWYEAIQCACDLRARVLRAHYSAPEADQEIKRLGEEARKVELALIGHSEILRHNFYHPGKPQDEAGSFAALADAVAALRKILPDDEDVLPSREQFEELREPMRKQAVDALSKPMHGPDAQRRSGGGPGDPSMRR